MSRSAKWLAGVGVSLSLAGCGGGGGSAPAPSPAPAPVNRAPAFTSAPAVAASENSSGIIYSATAADADGDALTFSIAGGADAAAFRISAAGALSFAAPPDFELPADADRNNIYLVRLQVSDGQATASLDLTVTITDVGNDSFRVTRVGVGFAQPLFVAPVPDGSGRVFVVERAGRIRILTPATGAVAATPFLDVSGETTTDSERGLLGLATAPDFATSGLFYVFLTNREGDIELRRYRTVAANRDVADPATADVILTIEHSQFGSHNGGWIGFGPDRLLYLGTGDGGGGGDPLDNGQNRNSLLGKILRLDVMGADQFPADPNRDYAIPAGNPFAAGGGAPEIWALGLRNPYRASFDPGTGNLFVGDVGQGAIEEIDLLRPGDNGANLGWPLLEGTRPFRGIAQPGLLAPVAEYEHGSGPFEGRSVTGGYVYRGPIEALQGLYIFGDFVSGNIWSIPIAEFVVGQTLGTSRFTARRSDFAPNQGAIGNISSFGVDQAGNLYIVDFDGEIFRIEPR